MENMRGRFRVSGNIDGIGDCLVLDDVFTTGSTVSECARVLRQAGAARVDSLTLALDY
jgi:predicted amidophosphoribosyltransferase